MAEKIAIDKNTFFNHLSNLYASWKADKRSGNALFGGADSMVILMGKTKTDESSFQKNNAMHVSHLIFMSGASVQLRSIRVFDTNAVDSSGFSATSSPPPSSSLRWKLSTWSLRPKKVT